MTLEFPLVHPKGLPFYFPGGPTGVLLVHGFTGAPNEMEWLGEYLRDEGYTVLGIRLAGHGTQPEDMVRSTWRHWAASVEDGLAILRGATRQQFIGGLSMGGALSLLASTLYPVAGCIALSTIYSLPDDWRVPYLRPISRLMPRLDKQPAQHSGSSHLNYPYYPTISLAELRDLLVEVRAALPRIGVPVFMAHSRKDPLVTAGNMDAIVASLAGAQVEQYWLENDGHVIVRGEERDQLFAAIADFIRRIERAHA